LSVSLTAFLFAAADRGFEAGRFDCGLWLADWVMAARGVADPCPDLRGLDHDAWLAHARQLPLVVARICRRLGLARIDEALASHGDISVIALHCEVPRGAIKTGLGWAFLTGTGVVNGPLPPRALVVAAWRVA
jgi:hypothetical protein